MTTPTNRPPRPDDFDSTAELAAAQWLAEGDIEAQLHPRRLILLDGSTYVPDFFLPIQYAWLEVKGPNIGRTDRAMLLAAHDATIPVYLMRFGPWRLSWLTGAIDPDEDPEVPAMSARCPHCTVGVIVAVNQQFCPACRHSDYRIPWQQVRR